MPLFREFGSAMSGSLPEPFQALILCLGTGQTYAFFVLTQKPALIFNNTVWLKNQRNPFYWPVPDFRDIIWPFLSSSTHGTPALISWNGLHEHLKKKDSLFSRRGQNDSSQAGQQAFSCHGDMTVEAFFVKTIKKCLYFFYARGILWMNQ